MKTDTTAGSQDATGSARDRVCRNCRFWSPRLMRCYHAPTEACPPESTCDGWSEVESPNASAQPRREGGAE